MSANLLRVPHHKPWSAANVVALQNPDDSRQPANTIRFEETLLVVEMATFSPFTGNHPPIRLCTLFGPCRMANNTDIITPHGKDAGEMRIIATDCHTQRDRATDSMMTLKMFATSKKNF